MLSPVEVRYWRIYKIENPDGQTYIGRTDDPQRRYNIHFGTVKAYRSLAVEESFKKFSKESHTFEILESFYGTIKLAHSKEIFWIRTYMSNVNKWPGMKGMNLTDGGRSISGYKFDKDVVEKRVSYQRGVTKSTEHLLKHNIGIFHDKERREKAGKARYKPVLVYDMNDVLIKEFESVKAACEGLNIPRGGHLTEACRGERESYKKYKFKYKT